MLMEADLPEDIEALRALALEQSRKLADVTVARDDRPWGGIDPPMMAYVYAADRKSERAEAHLGDFAGILQVDGYGMRTPVIKGAIHRAVAPD